MKSGTRADELKRATLGASGGDLPSFTSMLDVVGDEAADEDGLAKGTSVGRYTVLERLGAGGMGVVYAAYDPELDRKIALKLLRAQQGTNADEAHRQERLVREAKAIAKLSHPNVVGIFDVGVHEGRVFLAMEYLGGRTLRDWMNAKKRPWREIVKMFIEVGQGLAAAHAEGLIHRDFKPDNVLLDKAGKPKVADFGLVRLRSTGLEASGPIEQVPLEISDTAHAPLTRTGALAGTPAYMAPEQFLGKPIDARTDQFAFCVALYEALYNARPFAGDTVMALAGAVKKGRVNDAPKDSNVPAWVRRTTCRGLLSSADERYPAIDELLRALAKDPVARARRGAALVAAIAVILVVVFVLQQRAEYRRADIEKQIAARIADASAATSLATAARGRALNLRSSAFKLFDARRRDEGERIWKGARQEVAAADAAFGRAEQALDAALTIDSTRDRAREQLADTLHGRAVLAEMEHRGDDLKRHLARIADVDRSGKVKTQWSRPGRLALAIEPTDAIVELERYKELPEGRRELEPVSGSACRAGSNCALPAGSYRLRIKAVGRPDVLLPVVVKRDETVALSVRVPGSLPVGFAFVPVGRFIFGDYDESIRTSFLKTVPAHEVETKSYVISKTEVTYADWIEFLDQVPPGGRRRFLPDASEKKMASLQGTVHLSAASNGLWRLNIAPIDTEYSAVTGQLISYKGRRENSRLDWLQFPVSGVSGEQMHSYLSWLRASGKVPGARLCSEMEWERAARGADDRIFPHGDALRSNDANHDATYDRVPAAFGPDTVGLHAASRSPFGVDDLVGNVWELVASSVESGGHAIRGGGYYFFQLNGRITNREPFESGARSVHIGMRVCADWEG